MATDARVSARSPSRERVAMVMLPKRAAPLPPLSCFPGHEVAGGRRGSGEEGGKRRP